MVRLTIGIEEMKMGWTHLQTTSYKCFRNLFWTNETWCRLYAMQASGVHHAFCHWWICSIKSISTIILFLVTCTILLIGVLKGRHSLTLLTFHRFYIDLHRRLDILSYLCMRPLGTTHIHFCKHVCSRSCRQLFPQAPSYGTSWKIKNSAEAICIYVAVQ